MRRRLQEFRKKYKKRGFTLIELTVVIIIIVILASVAIPQFTKILERTKVSAAKVRLAIIRTAEGVYFSIHNTYTDDFDELAQEVPEVAEDILEDDPEWVYSIKANSTGFEIEAERTRGEYEGYVIKMNQNGKIEGTHPLI